jgi:hypothetical protein
MQTGKSGSYVCARAGAAAETTPIAKIAKAGMRMGPSLRYSITAWKQTADIDPGQFTFSSENKLPA